ncbi:MAG: hydrogenase accessory protein HypB, partial [Desulfosarcina sp.]|nr:hydrogenase accessory protein HypB [Desulfosarcina sp.]
MWFITNHTTKRYHHDHKHHSPHDHHHHHHHDDVETRKSGTREIKVVRRVLDANDIMAERMRSDFAEKKVFVLNMMSSPGSGKTTTLQKTLVRIMPDLRCAVIVGDICTTHDADRLA